MRTFYRLLAVSFFLFAYISAGFADTAKFSYAQIDYAAAGATKPACKLQISETDTKDRSPLESENQAGSDGEDKGVVKESGMTLERMAEIVKTIDANATLQGPAMQLTIADVKVTIITDAKNNRMRAFTVVQSLDGVNQQLLYRMLQANFDSALDARYAIAKAHILSVFIHPMKELQKNQLIEGLGQVVNLVKTYGSAFTSGAMTFGGGDSKNLHRQLIDELLKKGEEI